MISVVVVIITLILVNGLLVAMEMAIVTSQRTRLKIKSENGNPQAADVLAIQDAPSDFLATVQIGITLVGTAASAVGGAEIVRYVSPVIASIPGMTPYADPLSLVLIIVTITFLTLVFGELVPKQLALRNAENVAMASIKPLRILSWLTHLPMRILSLTTDAILKIVGNPGNQLPSTSSEEIRLLAEQGVDDGVLLDIEKRLISSVFDYADRRAQDVMTPRTSIIAFDITISPTEALQIATQIGYSRYPVYKEHLDSIVGYVHIKDIIGAKNEADLSRCSREIQFIPSGASLPEIFDTLTRVDSHIGIIIDEYGGARGLLTLEDMLEEIVGEIEDEHSPTGTQITPRKNGEWVFAGTTPITEVGEVLEIDFQPGGVYVTLAGFILASLGNIPEVGEEVNEHGYIFTVQEMNRLQITSIIVRIHNPNN
jgi:putative hemolysin